MPGGFRTTGHGFREGSGAGSGAVFREGSGAGSGRGFRGRFWAGFQGGKEVRGQVPGQSSATGLVQARF